MKGGLKVHVQSLKLKTAIYPILQKAKWPRQRLVLQLSSLSTHLGLRSFRTDIV